MYLAIAGCLSNDLFREALGRGITLDQVVVRVDGDFVGDPAVSTEVSYEVELNGDADDEALRDLIDHVDRIAEIPNSLRIGTPVRLRRAAILHRSR